MGTPRSPGHLFENPGDPYRMETIRGRKQRTKREGTRRKLEIMLKPVGKKFLVGTRSRIRPTKGRDQKPFNKHLAGNRDGIRPIRHPRLFFRLVSDDPDGPKIPA